MRAGRFPDVIIGPVEPSPGLGEPRRTDRLVLVVSRPRTCSSALEAYGVPPTYFSCVPCSSSSWIQNARILVASPWVAPQQTTAALVRLPSPARSGDSGYRCRETTDHPMMIFVRMPLAGEQSQPKGITFGRH